MRSRSLQSRILILVSLGIVLLLATIGTASYLSVKSSIDRLMHERLVLAQATADNLERALQVSLKRLGNSVGPEFDPRDGLDQERRAMQQAGWDCIFGDGVFLLDATGRPLVHVPPATRTVDPRSIAAQLEAALQGRSAISNVVELGSSGRKIVAGLEPLRDRDGRVMAVVGGGIDLTGNRLRELIQPRSIAPNQSIDILDAQGTVLASTQPSHLFVRSDHRNLVAGLIRERRSTVVECHSCHEQSRSSIEVMALTPLSSIPWAIAIRQDRRNVLRPADQLRDAMLVIGAIFLLGAGTVALASVRSVVRPIRMLTARVRSLSAGSLDEPVPSLGEDEIGELARHVESMRVRLRESLAEIRGWNAQLGQEVARRTEELEKVAAQNAVLFRELQRREEARGQLLAKIISAQEAERKRVARELHDSTSQDLAALVLRLDALRAAHPQLASAVAPTKELAVEILGEVHRLIFDLRPALLDDLGLSAALHWLSDKQFDGSPVQARFEVTGDERRLPPELETTLFRIAQEAINNVAKHAQATNVVISLTYNGGGVTIEVEDDGVGFDPESIRPARGEARGLGLLGMRERVELWDGTLVVDAAPERGTRIHLFVPYKGKDAGHANPNTAGG